MVATVLLNRACEPVEVWRETDVVNGGMRKRCYSLWVFRKWLAVRFETGFELCRLVFAGLCLVRNRLWWGGQAYAWFETGFAFVVVQVWDLQVFAGSLVFFFVNYLVFHLSSLFINSPFLLSLLPVYIVNKDEVLGGNFDEFEQME